MEGKAVLAGDSAAGLAKTAISIQASVPIYRAFGAHLYAEISVAAKDDPDFIYLVSQGWEGAAAVHVFSAVQYLLMREPEHPLRRYFPTFTDKPLPGDQAWPEFARFIKTRREDILTILHSRGIQTTYAERCAAAMAALSWCADEAGEPLNLIEIGCSAGILMTFDKYAYDIPGRDLIGSRDAPMIIPAEITGGPALRIPKIGARIGLDLQPLDARSPDDRDWLVALSFPEFHEERARLTIALDTVTQTDIVMHEGDALKLLPDVIAKAPPGPLCVFHSACVFYWPQSAKQALNETLKTASKSRELYRISIEPSENFDNWHRGESIEGQSERVGKMTGEIILTHYKNGEAAPRVVALSSADWRTVEWIGG